MLSDTQREILVLCFERNFISIEDILHLVRGFQPQAWGVRKAAIGESQYNSAYASMSRTLDRLWRRGLVKIWKSITGPGTGVTLTPAGEAMAQAILAEARNKG